MMAVSIVLDYHDSIDGPIPAFLGGGGGVSTVEWLDLGRSNLTGSIPDNLGTLPNLRQAALHLSASACFFFVVGWVCKTAAAIVSVRAGKSEIVLARSCRLQTTRRSFLCYKFLNFKWNMVGNELVQPRVIHTTLARNTARLHAYHD